MNHIPGILEIFEKETISEAAVPSPIEIRYLWNRMIMRADFVENLLSEMKGILKTLRIAKCKGTVDQVELENAEEWFRIRSLILGRMFTYWSTQVFLEQESFAGGEGI